MGQAELLTADNDPGEAAEHFRLLVHPEVKQGAGNPHNVDPLADPLFHMIDIQNLGFG
ncbi:hypothetical protein D3C84_1243900 [compost metagenome]